MVRVPVTVANTVAVLVLLGLAVLGSIYVYKLCTQPHCSCPMCEGDYVVQGTLGYVPLLLWRRTFTSSCRGCG